MNAFAIWLLENYAQEADTPLGTFARTFAPLLPTACGNRAELRAVVQANAVEYDALPTSWPAVNVFDVAWRQYQPTCAWTGCSHTACDEMSYCGVHAAAELL